MSQTGKSTVFVTAATGSQGGAVARQLRALGWTVRTTVRNIESPAARALRQNGIHLVQGDWDNIDAINAALEGCEKMFLNLYPDFGDLTRERRQAENIVTAAKAAGVKQVVASTTLGLSALEKSPEVALPGSLMAEHLAGKLGIEHAVRNGGFERYTFLRPSFLMANFFEPNVARYPEPRDHGTWTTAMNPDSLLALLDHEDIAKLAVLAFQDPDRLHGQAIGMVSEFLIVQDTLDKLSAAIGRPLKAIFMTEDEIAEKA